MKLTLKNKCRRKVNGGIYATPTIMGSKCGNNIVLTRRHLNIIGF